MILSGTGVHFRHGAGSAHVQGPGPGEVGLTWPGRVRCCPPAGGPSISAGPGKRRPVGFRWFTEDLASFAILGAAVSLECGCESRPRWRRPGATVRSQTPWDSRQTVTLRSFVGTKVSQIDHVTPQTITCCNRDSARMRHAASSWTNHRAQRRHLPKMYCGLSAVRKWGRRAGLKWCCLQTRTCAGATQNTHARYLATLELMIWHGIPVWEPIRRHSLSCRMVLRCADSESDGRAP